MSVDILVSPRRVTGIDSRGNDVYTWPEGDQWVWPREWRTAVEPKYSTETDQQGLSQQVVTGLTLYIEGQVGIGINAFARIQVAGIWFEVQGRVAEWRSPYSDWCGTVIELAAL